MPENQNLSAELRVRVALEKHRFHTTHSLGQNFLLSEAMIGHLLDLANLSERDNVLEIGPGAGLMTCLMAERARRVTAIELDKGLEPVLEEVLSGSENASVIYQDIMKTDLAALVDAQFDGEPYRVVANLPYYITADILLMLVSAPVKPQSICIMVQKEAAERLMSQPGSKQWCALAATLQYFGELRVLEEVPPEAFDPAPHVVSRFIRLDLYERPPLRPEDEKLFLRLLNAAFAMRRKTLSNNLKAAFGMDQAAAKEVLAAAGLDERVRGEALMLEELARLSDCLSHYLRLRAGS